MGTMSKFVPKTKKFGEGRANPRAGLANRVMTGLLIRDVLAVISERKRFNRATRRAVFSLWKRHARNLPGFSRISKGRGVPVGDKRNDKLAEMPPHVAAIARYKGVRIEIDHPALVQQRILARVGLI